MGNRNPLGYIYFARPKNSKLVKIGFSTRLKERMRSLSLSGPEPVQLLATIRATQHNEHELHVMLKKHRVHGEWFDATAYDVFNAMFIAKCLEHNVVPDMAAFLKFADKELADISTEKARVANAGT